ncbi:hypothetical protein BDW74DRAFT_142041 [Aspergillus multicolor]|uniref:uncharacterized protein n=1 Tax=Aspergillus multicolor TaxID=41759 RepID=UPI003CCD943A
MILFISQSCGLHCIALYFMFVPFPFLSLFKAGPRPKGQSTRVTSRVLSPQVHLSFVAFFPSLGLSLLYIKLQFAFFSLLVRHSVCGWLSILSRCYVMSLLDSLA